MFGKTLRRTRVNLFVFVILSGMDWVVANAVLPAVASISLTFFNSEAINDAADRLHNASIVVSAAAGNINIPACSYSPAGDPNVSFDHGKSILNQVQDTGTRVLDNTTPFFAF